MDSPISTPKWNSASAGFRCLILEDDAECAALLATLVETEGGVPQTTDMVSLAQATACAEKFDLFIIDQMLPDGTGSSFYYFIRDQGLAGAAIMLTGLPNLAIAVQLTRQGLFDYMTKPLDVTALRQSIRTVVTTLRSATTDGYVGNSLPTRETRQAIQMAAANPRATVLLTGETGAGKDRAARSIHKLTHSGAANERPFISVNCASVPTEIFESELFGAERGAFTGAHQRRMGLVEAAQGGTLFLDEISEMPLATQAKLLHLLESGEFRRLGGTEIQTFSGRLIAATNRSLADEAAAGRFRSDLMFRLDVLPIHIIPLRERREDIAPLAHSILTLLSQKHERACPELHPNDLATLLKYEFPGNVRELRNILERSLLQTPRDARCLSLAQPARRRPNEIELTVLPAEPTAVQGLSPLEAQECNSLLEALVHEQGRIRRAALRLGLSHQALLRRLKKWPHLKSALHHHLNAQYAGETCKQAAA